VRVFDIAREAAGGGQVDGEAFPGHIRGPRESPHCCLLPPPLPLALSAGVGFSLGGDEDAVEQQPAPPVVGGGGGDEDDDDALAKTGAQKASFYFRPSFRLSHFIHQSLEVREDLPGGHVQAEL